MKKLFSFINKTKRLKTKSKSWSYLIDIVEISRFLLIGIFSTLINFLFFIISIFLFSAGLIQAVITGYLFGFISSFYFGRAWILSPRYKFKMTTFFKFVFSYFVGGLITLFVISIASSNFQLGNILSWFIGTAITALLNFTLLKLWVFRDRKKIADQRWGGLSKLLFLQILASNVISYINPAITHNLEKYYAIKKVFYLSTIEDISGDYLEFGVFEGSSFSHAIRCYLNLKEYMPPNNENEINFYGFDSFDGFGKLDSEDYHPFYEDEQFKTSLPFVKNRIEKCSKGTNFKLIKGFFEETLSVDPISYGIKKARIIFIDADTFSSSFYSFEFCKKLIREGTYLILDDFYSYKGSNTKGVAGAFAKFRSKYNFSFREVFSYGMGGKVFICSNIEDPKLLELR